MQEPMYSLRLQGLERLFGFVHGALVQNMGRLEEGERFALLGATKFTRILLHAMVRQILPSWKY